MDPLKEILVCVAEFDNPSSAHITAEMLISNGIGVDQKVMANPFFIYRPVEINRQIRDSQKGINPF